MTFPIVKEEPVPIETLENIPQKLIDAVVDFMRDRANGCLEVHFSHGGVAKVIANRVITYK